MSGKVLDDGGPAFAHGNPGTKAQKGMTLLDYFAGQALNGMLAEWGVVFLLDDRGKKTLQREVSTAYTYAQAMITEKRRLELGESSKEVESSG
jgi:hypothetical protein